jgi:hypothetical protein
MERYGVLPRKSLLAVATVCKCPTRGVFKQTKQIFFHPERALDEISWQIKKHWSIPRKVYWLQINGGHESQIIDWPIPAKHRVIPNPDVVVENPQAWNEEIFRAALKTQNYDRGMAKFVG